MDRKYIVECPRCGQTFSSTYSRQAAIVALKNHSRRKHGAEVGKYVIKELEEIE